MGVSERSASPPVRIVIRRLKTGELLIIASRSRPRHALNIDRQRWKTETLFAALKTRGFNLRATPSMARLLIGNSTESLLCPKT